MIGLRISCAIEAESSSSERACSSLERAALARHAALRRAGAHLVARSCARRRSGATSAKKQWQARPMPQESADDRTPARKPRHEEQEEADGDVGDEVGEEADLARAARRASR